MKRNRKKLKDLQPTSPAGRCMHSTTKLPEKADFFFFLENAIHLFSKGQATDNDSEDKKKEWLFFVTQKRSHQ